MKTKSTNTRQPRKVVDVIYLVDDGNTFHGTLDQFKDCFFSNATELNMTEWARKHDMKLQRQTKRGKKFVLVTLHDPAKPERMRFQRAKWGLKAGQKNRTLTYTDSDGQAYTFYLNFDRDTRRSFDKEAQLKHKHEIEYRILNRLVKEYNGEEEPD